MDIKVIDAPENNTEVSEPASQPQPDGVMMREQVAQLFDFKPSEISQYQDKLETLIAYAKTKTDDHSSQGLKWAIRSLALKLGTPPLGEKSINYLTRYAYLSLEGQKINKELNKFNPEP